MRVWILILLILASSLVIGLDYKFEVSSNGETYTYITAEEDVILQIPQDANPEVEGGTYSVIAKGIELVGTNVMLAYSSSYHTQKQGGIWEFFAQVQKSKIELILPENVKIITSNPKASIQKKENIILSWEDVSGNISVSYVIPVTQRSLIQTKKQSYLPVVLVIFAILIGIVGGFLFKRKFASKHSKTEMTKQKNKKETSSLKLSEAKTNVLRAVSDNDSLILTTIIKHNGHIKRNALEKITKLSKSSLASSLKTLEKKKIVEIDRSFHVHYIKLSDWFKSL